MTLTHTPDEALKQRVREHWQDEACGTRYGNSDCTRTYFEQISATRYRLEPFIHGFAKFPTGRGKEVLEIGTGCGSDFQNWVQNGAQATGVDLTEKAIGLTRERLESLGFSDDQYDLKVADAENLPFDDERFDMVYSYGVLHHTPDTLKAFSEACRVLKPGGTLRAMIYHDPSWSGMLLWVRHCLLRGKPWKSAREAIWEHLESPGTKVYNRAEARELVAAAGFEQIEVSTKLGPGDLLTIQPSRKYSSPIYKIIWALYPRWLVRLTGDRWGAALLIEARKPLPPASSASRSAA